MAGETPMMATLAPAVDLDAALAAQRKKTSMEKAGDGVRRSVAVRLGALTRVSDLRGAEARARDAAAALEAEGLASGLSLGRALREAGEALVGVPRDLFLQRSAWEVFAARHRLRGLGVLCVLLGLAGLLAELSSE